MESVTSASNELTTLEQQTTGSSMYSLPWNQSAALMPANAEHTSSSSVLLMDIGDDVPATDVTDVFEMLGKQGVDVGKISGRPPPITLIVIAYLLVVLVSLIGNLFVVLVIVSKKRTRTTVNIFIANLAVSDLLMTVLNIPFTTARMLMSDWIFGSFLCHVSPFIQATSVYVSTLTMCFIAVDRFRAILQPMRRRISSKIASSFAIAAIWAIAMLFSLPFLFFNRIIENYAFEKRYVRCRVVYPEPEHLYKRSVNIITFILQFGIPFTIMVSLYMRIGIKIWSRTTIGATTREQENRQFIAKKRTIIMLLLVAIVFAFCWLPHNVYHFLVDFEYWNHDFRLVIGVHWLAMSSVCYNPFIYFWLNRRFQQILRAGVQRFCSNCYCLPNSSGCSCMGITCFCHRMTTAKTAHVSSPTSASSPRAQGSAARSGQAILMHHNNWIENRKGDVRKLKAQSETGEKNTGFNDPSRPAQETMSEYTLEDTLHSTRVRGTPRDPRSSECSANSSVSACPQADGRVVNGNSALSIPPYNNNDRDRKIRSTEKDLNTTCTSSSEGRSLLRSRNHHRQQQEIRNCGPRVWNQQKWSNITGRIFTNSPSKHSLSSSSSAGSGLNHQKHLICHYRGMRQPVHGNNHPLYQTNCNHNRLAHSGKHSSDHNIVLSSI